MALNEAQPEPSMEEILASIRRIISEEETPEGEAEPVLDLSQQAPAEDDLMVFDAEPEPAPAPAAAAPAPTPSPAPAQPPRAPAPPVADADLIVSEPAVTAAAGALTRLAGSLRIADQPGQTVEGVVRELLKPMLKEWLDRNLAAIVESRVEAELERIARLAR
ncbi:MAG: DUF2497 domain-containing protein [Hyphomonadaceae bacterium]